MREWVAAMSTKQLISQLLLRPALHVVNELRLITWTESLQYSEQDVASGMTRETDILTDLVHSCSNTSGQSVESHAG